MKTLLSAILFYSVLLAEDKPTTTPAKPFVETCKVFKIVCIRSGEPSKRYSATAFFISPTRLLTAGHEVKNAVDQWIDKDGRSVRCKLLKVDFEKDVALLECDEENGSFYRLVSTITVIGFPDGKVREESGGQIDRRIHAHVHFVPGMSGGPLVNEYGDVEGMGVENQSDYDCKAVPASVLADFIKSAK